MAEESPNARFSAIIPVLNDGCAIPSSVPLPLSDSISFQKIRGDDLAIITENDDEAFGKLKGGSYTLTFEGINPSNLSPSFDIIVAAAAFSLNILGSGTPLSLGKVYVIRSLRKASLHQVADTAGHRHGNMSKFEIPKGTDLSYASNLFSALCVALKKHPPLRITISRYSSAIGRASKDDKLIDLCIALESVFQAQSEISFQFALYNSILSETDQTKRISIFKTLKKLYSQRSNVVHGNKDLDAAWLDEKWDDLVGITKASILRKIDFLNENEHAGWRGHLEGLALGVPNGQNAD